MGRGHPINLNSVLKPLLHAECRQACLPSSLMPSPFTNSSRPCMVGDTWTLRLLSVTSQQLKLLGPHNKCVTKKKFDYFKYRAPQVHIISEWAGHQRCASGAVDSSKASSETLMSPVCLCSALSEGLVLSHPGLGVCSTAGLWTVSYIPLFTC